MAKKQLIKRDKEVIMPTEKNKAGKILNELVDYFFRHEIHHMEMSLHYTKEEIVVHIEGDCDRKPENYDELYRLLNEERRPELEEYYYSLLGGDFKREALSLLGSLIDRAEMSYEMNKLSITVYRHR